MIDAITRGMLGEFGSAILDFYQQNAIWINLLILVYAIALWGAKKAYRNITVKLKSELEQKYGENFHQKSISWIKRKIEKNEIDWHQLAESTQIPIISIEKSFWFKIRTPKVLQEHFTPEKIYEIFQNEP